MFFARTVGVIISLTRQTAIVSCLTRRVRIDNYNTRRCFRASLPTSLRFSKRKMSSLSVQDPNSFSKPEEAVVDAFHWNVVVDFDSQIIKGHVDFDVTRVQPKAEFLTLDSAKNLSISNALCVKTGNKLDVDQSVVDKIFGVCTKIRLPEGEKVKIRIDYQTAPDSSALQWLTKEQTAGKKNPYVYSHSEAIHSRALLPCQDTPNVKSSFTAKIQAPHGLTAMVSAVKTGEEPGPNESRIFSFDQKIPVPVYLLALAVGEFESRKIGPRSHVWAEKNYIDMAVIDFADTEQMIKTAEDLMGDYVWGAYDLLVLPPSFPLGGMENPCLTFITPTVLTGDKSLANVVTHEIAHSWTGNLVTNKNFEHFWLNEGFTMYVERSIIGKMFGEDMRQFHAQEGLKNLQYVIDTMGKDNPLTKLVVDLKGVDPEDAFSSVPYEKGFTFLYFLETLFGVESFEAFLKAYVERFKFKSIETIDFKNFLYEYFADRKAILDKNVDWNAWLYTPGMPPVIPDYKSSLAVPCRELCNKWIEATDEQIKDFTKDEFDKLNAKQKQEFFAMLLQSEILCKDKVAHLSALYKMEAITNSEIQFHWLRLGILARWEGILKPVTSFVEIVGRMKFVSPLFKDLGEWAEKRQYALDLFDRLKPNMMHILKRSVEDALKIRK